MNLNMVAKGVQNIMKVSPTERIDNFMKQTSNPVVEYYENNYALAFMNPSVFSAIRELFAYIVSEGFTFRTKDMKYLQPSADFKALFDRHWINFIHEAMYFISAQGYLLWCKAKTPYGDEYPIVCTPNMANATIQRDPQTLRLTIVPEWLNPFIMENHPIYIISDGLHTRFDNRFEITPVDECKEYIRMSLEMHKYYMTALKNGAQPSILLRSAPGDGVSRLHGESFPMSTGIGDSIVKLGQMAEKDGMNQFRVKGVVEDAVNDNMRRINDMMKPVPPATRHRIDSRREIAEDFQYIPYGMTPHETSTNVQIQRDFMDVRREIDSDIRAVFGLPSRPHNGAIITDTQSILAMTPTMKAWLNSVSVILSTVYSTIFQDTSVALDPMGDFSDNGSKNVNSHDIKIIPVKLVLSDYDMCATYTEQGGISLERFAILHLTKTLDNETPKNGASSSSSAPSFSFPNVSQIRK